MDNTEMGFIEENSPETEELTETEQAVEMTEEAVAPEEETAEALPEEGAEESAGDVANETAPDAPADTDAPLHIEDGKRAPIPYEKRYYMLYGGEEVPSSLDLAGTREFLSNIGFNGGELSKAREGKDYAAVNEGKAKNGKSNLWCSYCGREITGADYYRLKDGRKRCTVCSRSIVKTEEQLNKIYQRVRKNMETFFDVSLDADVNVYFVDERKLKKKMKIQIGSHDDQSILILGCATFEKQGYAIYLENSAPLLSVTATIAHELTHIWQFTNWNEYKQRKKKKKIKGHTIEEIEGMAKWAEIQYLYLIGEKRIAEREEAVTEARSDEYGRGFRAYVDEYPLSKKAMTKGDTPFVVKSK